MIITKFRFANLNLAKTLIWWLCSEEFSSYFHRVSGECPPPPPPSPFPPPPSLSFWIIKNYFKNRVKESRSEAETSVTNKSRPVKRGPPASFLRGITAPPPVVP